MLFGIATVSNIFILDKIRFQFRILLW